MMSLRALGNTGHAEEAVPSLYNCISKKKNPMDIKIAAVQAFRRLSCGADVSFYLKVPKRRQQSITPMHSKRPNSMEFWLF